KIDMFSVGWREVLEQFNFVSVTFENGDRNVCAWHSGDFAGEIAGVMCAMRKLEAEDALPKGQRTVKARDRDAGMIRCNDLKRRRVHDQQQTSNVQSAYARLRRGTSNSEDCRGAC